MVIAILWGKPYRFNANCLGQPGTLLRSRLFCEVAYTFMEDYAEEYNIEKVAGFDFMFDGLCDK